MKISEVIEALLAIKEKFGDIPVLSEGYEDMEDQEIETLDDKNVVDVNFYDKGKEPKYAVVI